MGKFVNNCLSSAIGVIIAVIILIIISIIFVLGISFTDNSSQVIIDDNCVLNIKLEGTIQDRATAKNPLDEIFGSDLLTCNGLDKLRAALDIAKNNDKIKGVFIEAGIISASPATLQELRQCLQDFKKSGKFIISYADTYSQGAYYVCSVSDKVLLNKSGELVWKGLNSEIMFYTKLLEKLGVKAQVYKVGTYKSAVEPYINTKMSEANKEQVNTYLKCVWECMLQDVSKDRKISIDKLNEYADNNLTFAPQNKLKELGMVDSLVYIDEAKSILKKELKIKQNEKIKFASIEDVYSLKNDNGSDKIAIYYAQGEIVDFVEENFGNEETCISSKKVITDLEKIEEDKNIKAVVIRLNTPGGSAYGSEQIWHALKKLGTQKPVVISMGGMAASGGYYIASAADYIVAEPTTITGSIGIFGLIFDLSDLMKNKLFLNFDCVKTNQMADMGTMSRPFNEQEGDLIQKYVERGYNQFIGHVATARNKTTQQIDSIAQGRVWTGSQAMEIGLVDKLGTMKDAINYVAQKAKLNNGYTLCDYPEYKEWYMTLLDDNKKSYFEEQIKTLTGEYYEPIMTIHNMKCMSSIKAMLPYCLIIR